MDICVIGAGRIGKVHAPHVAAHPKARLRCVVDPDLAAARALAEPLGAQALAEIGPALADKSIGAVIIAGPTPTHVDYSVAAAAAGKAIFCEKPIDLDIARVETCRAAVAKAKVPFYLGFHMRFDPSVREIKQAIRDGRLGRIEQATFVLRDPSPPPPVYVNASGGIFRDMMIHVIDLIRWLFGEDPVEAFAMGSCLIEPYFAQAQDYDTAQLMLRLPSGALCQIVGGRRSAYGGDYRAEIFGSKGLMQLHNGHPTFVERWGEARAAYVEGFTGFQGRYAPAYYAELDHFIDAVENDKPLLTGIEDGRRSLLIADAATESARAGKPVAIKY